MLLKLNKRKKLCRFQLPWCLWLPQREELGREFSWQGREAWWCSNRSNGALRYPRGCTWFSSEGETAWCDSPPTGERDPSSLASRYLRSAPWRWRRCRFRQRPAEFADWRRRSWRCRWWSWSWGNSPPPAAAGGCRQQCRSWRRWRRRWQRGGGRRRRRELRW